MSGHVSRLSWCLAVALWRECDRASELTSWPTSLVPVLLRPSLDSAKLPGDDVINELCVARPESRPALSVDNERGEGSGRELLLELGQVSTPGSKHTSEVVEARVVPDEHHRTDGLGKSPEPLEQFLLRGGVELRHELDCGALAERRPDRLERLASAKRRGAEDESGADFLPPHVLGDGPRRAFASRRERAVEVGKGRIRPARLPVPKQDHRSHPRDRACREVRGQAVRGARASLFSCCSPECLDGHLYVAVGRSPARPPAGSAHLENSRLRAPAASRGGEPVALPTEGDTAARPQRWGAAIEPRPPC
jgi:hypothetical protein